MLHINDLTCRIAGRLLIDRASMALPDGAKAGLVGRNGAGKTTLFRVIAGEIAADTGSIRLPKNTRVGQVAQEAPGGPESLIEVVLAADRERAALMAEAETARDGHRIAEIHTRLADIDAHAAEARAGSILAGLGFPHEAQKQPCARLSGGWRMRVALAAVLFSEPDLLLLDEPTNYLDLEGTLWLETFLARYPRTALIISHDRDLLNGAVDRIVHLDQMKLTVYRGGYDQFDRQRRERLELEMKTKRRLEDERRHMEAFVARFRAKATKARQAQSRLKALQRMAPIPAIVTEQTQRFDLPNPEKPLASPIVTLEDASVGYVGNPPVLSRLSLRIDGDDRIALLGQNGNGKSTLAKLLAAKLKACAGTCKRHPKLQVGYFAQHQLDELNPRASAFDHVRALLPDATEAQARARVARFGLSTDKMETPSKDLSGGEKARLLLGLTTFFAPHLLILDEPTNHLDVEAREALAQALAAYEGAVILISHDRHLIETCADRLWLVADGTVRVFDGDMADYRRQVLEPSGGASTRKPAAGNTENGRESAADRRRQAAERRAEQAPLRARVREAESDMEGLRKEIERLDAKLAAPGLYDHDPGEAARLAKERAEAERSLAETEEQWLALAAELEEAKAGNA